MSVSTHRALTSSQEPNWRTPQWLFDALNKEFHFLFDAAADEENHLCNTWLGPGSPLISAYGSTKDALSLDWYGLVPEPFREIAAVFCNPPYSREKHQPIGPWLKHMAFNGRYIPVVGVVPYSPQTEWWRRYIIGMDTPELRAAEIRKFPYRLKFDPPPDYTGRASGANVNTVIVIWRPGPHFLEPWAPFERYWDPRPASLAVAQARTRPSGRGRRGAARTGTPLSEGVPDMSRSLSPASSRAAGPVPPQKVGRQ